MLYTVICRRTYLSYTTQRWSALSRRRLASCAGVSSALHPWASCLHAQRNTSSALLVAVRCLGSSAPEKKGDATGSSSSSSSDVPIAGHGGDMHSTGTAASTAASTSATTATSADDAASGRTHKADAAGNSSSRSPTLPKSDSAASPAPRYRRRHTRDKGPKVDANGLTLYFSQGMTDYCWKGVPGAPHVLSPSVLHRETAANRIRMFAMPKGFPDTTAEGFQSFFYLSQASAFVSNFASSIGFQSLLSGFFLGSSPQLWMLKDLIPALLAAYMANRVVSYENRPKFWFCVSVFMNNVTVISDMIIPSAVPGHLLAAAIVTSTVKQSASLMYFVTRAAALQHYAINNNLAELTKKFNSFGIVNYTVATALGIVYCTFIASFTAQLVTVVACCVTNMYLSSKSMTPITFRLLNFGTMYLLLRAYLKESGRIMTPQDVSDLLGVRMSPLVALREAGIEEDVSTELIYVSPPIDKLLIRTDALDEDVLYLNNNRMFMLAMWKPAPLPLTLRDSWHRHELPSLPNFIRDRSWRRVDPRVAEMEKRFGGHRLCLLVHHKCTPRDLVTAYLIMYAAVLQHASTEAELRAFLRQCHAEQEVWRAKGDSFRDQLEKVNWDVKLPALDHHNYRMSELIIPPRMRGASSSSAAGEKKGTAVSAS